ncbi:MAG: carboxypeptidase-like regulatory domain-containing protein [Pirellulales bacterium]|nr:carboxypeptidase-like regulatory domain-containing protein [Pirellulales bacterium]
MTGMRRETIAVTLSALCVLAGCSGEQLGPVTGRVTLDDAPLPNALVLFEDQDRGIFMTAKTDTEGVYEVSMAKGYGLPLGTYQVAVKPGATVQVRGPDEAAVKPRSPILAKAIPRKYQDARTSGLSIDVLASDNRRDIPMKSR